MASTKYLSSNITVCLGEGPLELVKHCEHSDGDISWRFRFHSAGGDSLYFHATIDQLRAFAAALNSAATAEEERAEDERRTLMQFRSGVGAGVDGPEFVRSEQETRS